MSNPPQSPLIRGEVTTSDSARKSPSPDKGRAGEGFSSGVGLNSAFLPYNQNLRELARANRRNPTPAEARIWNEVLRNKQFAQYKFVRQKPIGSFIADFYCSRLQLVIEIDGESHAQQIEYDHLRTQYLASLGLRVVRFSNRDVMENLEGVFQHLQQWLK